jgi:hypothetical protein
MPPPPFPFLSVVAAPAPAPAPFSFPRCSCCSRGSRAAPRTPPPPAEPPSMTKGVRRRIKRARTRLRWRSFPSFLLLITLLLVGWGLVCRPGRASRTVRAFLRAF